MKSITFIQQQDEKDCGVACLAMILRHYRAEIPIHKLREMSGTDTNGTSAFGLKKCMEQLDFECQAIEVDSSIWKEKRLPFPLIAHVIVDNTYMHYVVVYGVSGQQLFIADPELGKIKKDIIDFSKEWTGILLLMTPTSEYIPSIEKVSGLTSFLPIIWKQKTLIFYIVLASLFITLFGISGSYYFQGLIDFFIPNQAISTLNIISIGLIISYFFQSLFEYSRNYLLLILGQRMSLAIMLKYFKHVLSLPMNFFLTRKAGEIFSRFLDANKIIDALASATLSIFLDLGMIIVIGITLALQNGVLFLVTLSSVPIYLITIISFVKIYEKANREEMVAGASLNSSIIESLKGIETIKAYNGEERVYNRVDHEFVNLMKKSFRTVNLDNLQQGIKAAIQLINSTVILWIGSIHVMDGSISIGQLITYNALLVFFTNPLQNLINLQVKMQTAQVANTRLNEIFAIDAEQNKYENRKSISSTIFLNGIRVKNLTFSYNMKTPILKDISFKIPSNAKVAIVGASGSGKSTLAKLLVNFYIPTEGSIRYGRINNQDIQHKQLRNHVTYVPQESFFFCGTIYANLVFGLDNPPLLEKVVEVCESVQLMPFIDEQPLRFETLIEEGGTNLSGGQRQRLAIARALLKDADILILDEATSGMDTVLEASILKYLLALQNKTLIFIAHHLPVAKSCEKILVLEDGCLVEQGTHEQLRYGHGVYQKLWEI